MKGGEFISTDSALYDALHEASGVHTDLVVLPAISCLATLCVDLGIDYGDGLQVFEASDLMLNEDPLNPRLHTLILQPHVVAWSNTPDSVKVVKGMFRPFQRYLRRFYPGHHPVLFVVSDDGEGGARLTTRIDRIDHYRRYICQQQPASTVYLPPR